MVIDILTRIGTNMLLLNNEMDGDTQHGVLGALRMAKSIVILENYIDIGTDSLPWTVTSRVVASKLRDYKEKMIGIEFVIDYNSGRRDGLKFFSKRISCLCLKKMHQEARKTITKTGMCWHCKENQFERVELLFKSYKKMVIDILTRIGTNMLLLNNEMDGDTQHGVLGALRMAKSIVILENYIDIGTDSLPWTVTSRVVASKLRDYKEKMIGIEFVIDYNSGRRDGLKFFSKRISCLCLKKMHQEARKTITKTGMCWHCKENQFERVELSVCSRCMITQYCSRECQVANWPQHKRECDVYVMHMNLTHAVSRGHRVTNELDSSYYRV